MTILPSCGVGQSLGGGGDETDGGWVHWVHDGDGDNLDNLGLADTEGDGGRANHLHHLLARARLDAGLQEGPAHHLLDPAPPLPAGSVAPLGQVLTNLLLEGCAHGALSDGSRG